MGESPSGGETFPGELETGEFFPGGDKQKIPGWYCRHGLNGFISIELPGMQTGLYFPLQHSSTPTLQYSFSGIAPDL
jgi:hypothetical protein